MAAPQKFLPSERAIDLATEMIHQEGLSETRRVVFDALIKSCPVHLISNHAFFSLIDVTGFVKNFVKWIKEDGSPLPKDTPPHMANAKNVIPMSWVKGSGSNVLKVPAGGL